MSEMIINLLKGTFAGGVFYSMGHIILNNREVQKYSDKFFRDIFGYKLEIRPKAFNNESITSCVARNNNISDEEKCEENK